MSSRTQSQEERRNRMLNEPVYRVIPAMAVPTIVAFLINSIYSLADTYFVSSLGTNATAAVSVNASLDQLIMMCGSLLAVGTNSAATAAMVKAGASAGATGEYAVVYNAARADVLAGPIGIVLAGGMMGEFSPAMARAVAESPAQKVLVPVSRCGVQVAGLEAKPLGGYIADAAELILTQCRSSAL